MKKLVALALVGSMAIGLAACGVGSASSAAPAQIDGKQNLVLGTGGTEGTYYAIGNVMADVLNDKLQLSHITVKPSEASKANILDIDNGTAQLGTVQNDVMYYAYTGTDLFKDEGKIDSFSAVASLYNETVQIVTCDASIQTVADLKGKAVSVGAKNSGVEFNAEQILAAYDLDFDDIKAVHADFTESAKDLQTGKIDAAFVVAGIPTAAVVELATSRSIHLVQLDAEHIAKLQSAYNFYTETTVPAGIYTGMEDDTKTVAVRAVLVAGNDVSEDAVYELTKALFENQPELASEHTKFELLKLEDATIGIGTPFHEGAAKYYAEQGNNVG